MRTIDILGSRPGILVPSCRLVDVATYFEGYVHALVDHGAFSAFVWREFIACRHGISSNTWTWHRTLLHVHGSEQAAIAALPSQDDAYVAELERVGVDGVREQWQIRFGGRTVAPDAPGSGA